MEKIESHKLIISIEKEALPLNHKIKNGIFSGENNQRQKYNMKLFLKYVCPIILQIERIELIPSCLNCNKITKKSNNIIIPLENYFKDIYGLFERVLSLIKYIYKIKSKKRGIHYVIQELEKNNIFSLVKKLKKIESDKIYKIVLDIRTDATHYNSPMRNIKSVERLIKYENILDIKNNKNEFLYFLLKKDFKKELRKTKRIYKEYIDKINRKTEKDIIGLLDIIYDKYMKYIETLNTTPKKFSINIINKFI